MSEPSMAGRDLYLKHTSTDGQSAVRCHRVWDADKFLLTLQSEATKANRDAHGNSPRLAAVELSTREQYAASRSPRK